MPDHDNLPGDPVSGDPVTTDSGLAYYEISEGEGDSPRSARTRVRVHYSGWLTNGKKFDSSVDRGEPATFFLDEVISGWTEGVGSMRVGGKRKLVIPHHLGYGDQGVGPIPGGATLVFDVELLEIV
ncbi:MAG: FKBP-type peptidyl-prolyl cis-trans isomerase [Phycisphaerales bacterium]|nr:MAG: FKBP-type peptidyl-prolyl cis-trans isomerase [Phycisphaerales bacterium]